MVKFLSKAGIILETDDQAKIECYKAKGLKELINEPQPIQDVEVAEDYIVRPAKKKKKTTTKK